KSDVAVVGAGNSAGQAVMYLAECCRDRKVHMFIRHQFGPGMSEDLVQRIRGTLNVVIYENTQITRAIGDGGLREVEIKTENDAHHRRLACGAVFVFIGADPSAPWLPKSLARDKLGYLLTGSDVIREGLWPLKDRDPCPLETNIPGLLAAGDIR